MILIRITLYGVLAIVLLHLGYGAFSWQYWSIYLLAVAIGAVAALEARRDANIN